METIRQKITLSAAVWLVTGLCCGVKLNIVGEIYVGEILSLIYLGYSLFYGQIPKLYWKFFTYALIWVFIQTLSDIYNATPLADSMKGILAPLVFCGGIYGLSSLMSEAKSDIVAFIFGLSLSQLLFNLVDGPEIFLAEPWKWGLASFVLNCFLVFFSFHKTLKIGSLFLFFFAFALFSFVQNARSTGLMPFLGFGLYILTRSSFWLTIRVFLRGRWAVVVCCVSLIFAAILLNSVMGYLFSSRIVLNMLPSEVAHKYERQATSDVGLLLAGRSESLVSLTAIKAAPWLGHGSWAVDKDGYMELYALLRKENRIGLNDQLEKFDTSLIPAHSFIFSAMVWGGVFASIFWVYVIFWILRLFTERGHRLPIYFHVFLVGFLWRIFFSPFGAANRWGTAISLAIVIVAIDIDNHNRKRQPKHFNF